MTAAQRPIIGLTMGDAAGIGPEVIVRAAADVRVRATCRPVVYGRADVIQRAVELVDAALKVVPCDSIAAMSDWPDHELPCVKACADDIADVAPGIVDARAGRAAHDCLIAAAEGALRGEIAAVVTAPLNKAAINRAGFNVPGHTELLAKLCGVDRFAMMLALPRGPGIASPDGLCVAHVTLHTSIASVPGLLSIEGIRQTIELVDSYLKLVGTSRRRIAVCALNPHAGEAGLFGDEESRIIAPAAESAKSAGLNVSGPFPADTLICRAAAGEFDGIVAMYHDQGHIAFKLLGFDRAVNITLGLPIVRTSPSHGTAFDIAWQGIANADGMIEAIRIARRLVESRY